MNKITPCLWFDGRAEEAIGFYTSVFKNSKVGDISRYGEGAPLPAGAILTAMLELEGQEIMLLNGGPDHPLTEAISLYVHCETQAEVDDLWKRLSEGGEEGPCGWLKDRYGLSWQIVPNVLGEMLGSGDPVRSQRVMAALLKMGKLDIAGLKRAYEGK
jgi:predicted 3-demethylubiquinone-9 3-methyltransferase (glyoxalase superfamily)